MNPILSFDEYKRKQKYALQRVSRGYDDLALWNLDEFIADKVGSILTTLSTDGMGWPGPEIAGTVEKWNAQLAKAGKALLDYKAIMYEWSDKEANLKAQEEAKEALHWVADHLGMLWD